jgi:hypothetical protein
MATSDPSARNPRRKKKPSAKGSAKTARKRRGRGVKKPEEEEAPTLSVSRLERTRRLLLAALRVWELKRRLRD